MRFKTKITTFFAAFSLSFGTFFAFYNSEVAEVKAEETATQTEATFGVGTSAGMQYYLTKARGESTNYDDENYCLTWRQIDTVTVTNDANDVPNVADYVVDPIEAGSFSETKTKTTVTLKDGTTKEFNIAGFLTKHNDYTDANPKFNFTLYANVDQIYAHYQSQYLFAELESMKTLNLKCFSAERAKDLSCAFYDCPSLEDLSFLEKFNATSAEHLYGFFSYCTGIKNVDFSKYTTFRPTNLLNLEKMFMGCTSLQSVNLSPLDGSKIYNISEMFHGCKSIEQIDLSFITSQNIQYCWNALNCSTYDFDGKLSNPVVREINIINMGLSNVDFTSSHGEDELNMGINRCSNLRVIYSPAALPEGKSIELNAMFPGDPALLTNDNLSQRISNIPSQWYGSWILLRADTGGNICNVLIPNSFEREEYEALINEYDNMDPRDKAVADTYYDVKGEADNLLIKDTITYLKAVLAGTQATEKDYGLEFKSEGNNITLINFDNSNAIIVVIIVVSSIIAFASYAITMRKKYN